MQDDIATVKEQEAEILVLPDGRELELSLKNPLFKDFERMPATFERFISDPYYLGKSWKHPFPTWRKTGSDLFPLPLRSPYSAVVLLGATGIGKTSAAINMIMAYFLHVVLCLRNPQEYFDLEEQKKIVFAVINIVTKAMAYRNAWGMLHKALLQSPFFMEYGEKSGDKRPEWFCTKKPVDLLYGSTADQVVGLDVLCAFIDEASFARNQSIQRQMEKAKEVFNAVLERIQSRFTKFGGIFDGLLIFASSKRTDQAFAEVYANQLLEGKNGHKVYVVDKPRWEVLPKGTYSGKTFPLAIGDKLRPSEIILEKDVDKYVASGYRIIYPPIETYDEFKRDMLSALTNIAGESVNSAGTYFAGEYIAKCIDATLVNPFNQGCLEIGSKDLEQYWQYFDMSKVSPEDLAQPWYIHIDASLGQDGNSISGGVISYAQNQLDVKTGAVFPELHYKQIFKVKVRAPKGDRTMLQKNEKFIFWLVQQGVKIAVVTSDQYQSVSMGQNLVAGGINYRYQSIDRVTNGINKQYEVLRNVIYEGRIRLLADQDQTDELLHLVRYPDGRVDKSQGNSDDAAQVLCGWVYSASLNKEQFVLSHTVLEATMLGSTGVENKQTLEEILPPEEIFADLFRTEIGAYKTQSVTGLRSAFDIASKNKQDDKEKNKGVSPFNFF